MTINLFSRSAAASLSVSCLTAVGTAYTAFGTWKLTRFVWRHYLRRLVGGGRLVLSKRYGSTTAIVTGATSGIGRCCAIELAREGFDVVLIARSESDLNELANMLSETYHVQAMAVPMDASIATLKDIQNFVVEPLETKSAVVGILVNTLGIHNKRPCTVQDMDWELADRILTVNCRFPLLLTSQVIPLLKKNVEIHQHAGILNWGSLTSCTPMALLSTYAATKAWMLHWSRCLAAELQPEGVDVLCAQPGLTATNMLGDKPPGGIVADPSIVARNALSLLGVVTPSQKRITPTPLHSFFVFLMENVLPESLQDSLNRTAGLKKRKEQ